ncbi:2Fe-2S iron-sulfur cluster binding domain-containing protein [Rhodococcus sp. ABRD24]|uniref:2Fe-2S iron-sulfur cluster-binding protein n=1 Tax=Rhodococcus sp. ABRD24 TaxID=2507582 RepID=UPI00103E12BD|nr:2Fe-2S iron-sulfur cluster-binding protein [Rhodococcus sp. ABRD24]QBJ97325.1 2Fe-2S iron-sulfur cluster binding domain-containing protein [Rhodococcus sp. ABRD24]
MPRIIFIAPTGSQETVDGAAGSSIMEAAVQNGVSGIVGECGGAAACSTCHVYIDYVSGRNLPPVSDLEDEMLDGVAAERSPSSRLACQIRVSDLLDGLIVRTPTEQR